MAETSQDTTPDPVVDPGPPRLSDNVTEPGASEPADDARPSATAPPSSDDPAGSAPLNQLLFLRRSRPKVVIAADLIPALSVLSTVALVGLPVAWIWSRLAPPARVRVTSDGGFAPLPTETYHRFDGIAIFLVLTFGVGVLIGAAVWSMRRRRGPVVLIAAVLGSLVAAWLAANSGLSFASDLFPLPDSLPAGTIFDRPPVLDVPWLILAAPMGTAFAYGAATAWNGADDLGRRR